VRTRYGRSVRSRRRPSRLAVDTVGYTWGTPGVTDGPPAGWRAPLPGGITIAAGGQAVRRPAGPARTLSAICPCTAGNSRTPVDTAGPRRAQSSSPQDRENPGHGLFTQVVAGPGFEPGKAKPTVLQTAPFGRSGNLPCAAQDGTVKDSGPSGCLRQVHATVSTLPGPVSWKRPRPAPAPSERAWPAGGQCRPVPRRRGRRDGADSRALEITRRRRLREGEDGTAPAEQRPASGEPVRPPSDGRPSDAIG
jgi:hypothetical protein